MASVRTPYEATDSIWLTGRPRFLRETLSLVLKEIFGEFRVRDVADSEPPTLPLPTRVRWLIWFLNGKHEINTAIEHFTSPPDHLNLLLIQNDGHAFVRWADHAEMHRYDISLEELTVLLKTSGGEWQGAGSPSQKREIHDTHWQ